MNNQTFIHFGLFLISIVSFTSSHLVLDLSHDLNNKTLRWPASTQFTMMPAFQGMYIHYNRIITAPYLITIITKHTGYSHAELPENDEKNYW